MTTVSVTMATTLNLILTFSVIIGNAFVVSPDLKRHIVPQALSSLLSSSSSSPSSSLLSSVSEAESIAMDTSSATGRILLPSTDPTRFDFGCVANPVVRIYIVCLHTFIYIYMCLSFGMYSFHCETNESLSIKIPIVWLHFGPRKIHEFPFCLNLKYKWGYFFTGFKYLSRMKTKISIYPSIFFTFLWI